MTEQTNFDLFYYGLNSYITKRCGKCPILIPKEQTKFWSNPLAAKTKIDPLREKYNKELKLTIDKEYEELKQIEGKLDGTTKGKGEVIFLYLYASEKYKGLTNTVDEFILTMKQQQEEEKKNTDANLKIDHVPNDNVVTFFKEEADPFKIFFDDDDKAEKRKQKLLHEIIVLKGKDVKTRADTIITRLRELDSQPVTGGRRKRSTKKSKKAKKSKKRRKTRKQKR